MKFEVLKRSHIKRNILIGIIVVLILSAVLLTFTRAKYKITESIPLVNGTINYELSDFNLIGAYIQEGDNYTQVDEIPTSGYEFNVEKSYCTVNDENINATLNYDMATQTLSVVPLTTKGTKCYLYFDEKASGGDYILAGDNPPTNSTIDWTGGTSYYYTGNPNNWVQFGGFWWRIIRINGDGTIRLIYNGTSTTQTGDSTMINTNQEFNNSPYRNAYVGYMYGNINANDYVGTHANTNSSTIKGVIDSWYNNNLRINYGDYIDGNSGFCGDRSVSSGSGTGTNPTDYQPYTRISNSNPSLSCEELDIYTTKVSSTGNKALDYPIGLISADEAMFAGIPWYNSNQNNYLYTGENYWTMSPAYYGSYGVSMFIVNASGGLDHRAVVSDVFDVRPVINLRSDIQITGTGTTSDPFKVVGAE